MTLLVTGASGFLGLNLLRQLLASHPDARLVAADLQQPEAADYAALGPAAQRIEFHTLDVRDRYACFKLCEQVKPTHIVHAAALTLSDDNTEAFALTWAVNFEGSRHMLDAAIAAGSVQRCLVLSSSGVYGAPQDGRPCDEDHPLQLSHSYAFAKREAEWLMAARESLGKFPIVAARVGPVYGPFERARGTRPRVSTIRTLFDALLTERTLVVGGTDCIRDWTHAADIAHAIDLLLTTPTLRHRIYNVSSGIGLSTAAVIDTFMERGLKISWQREARAADITLSPDQNRKPLVITRLQTDTGFVPRYDLNTGIEDMLALRAAHA